MDTALYLTQTGSPRTCIILPSECIDTSDFQDTAHVSNLATELPKPAKAIRRDPVLTRSNPFLVRKHTPAYRMPNSPASCVQSAAARLTSPVNRTLKFDALPQKTVTTKSPPSCEQNPAYESFGATPSCVRALVLARVECFAMTQRSMQLSRVHVS